MAARKPLTAKQDLAEAGRRAKAARTPIAKAATKQVLDRKRSVYNGEPARKAAAQARRATQPAATKVTRGGTRATPVSRGKGR